MKKIGLIILGITIILQSCILPCFAMEKYINKKNEKFVVESEYTKYIKNSGFKAATQSLGCKAIEFYTNDTTDASVSGIKSYDSEVLIWKSRAGSITYRLEVPESALYNISLEYLPLEYNGLNIEFGLRVDGEYPYELTEKLELPLIWINDGDVKTDLNGNQYAPNQIQLDRFVKRNLYDPDGVIVNDLQFALSQGIHEITIENCSQPIALASIALVSPENVKSYEEVSKDYDQFGYKNYSGKAIIIEGENAKYKTTRSLVAKSDSTSMDVSPNSPIVSMLNYIGSSNWKSPQEELTWEINVKKDGLYQLGFNFKQSTVIDGASYRWLKIDGKTPFREAENIAFNYGTSWQYEVFGVEGKPYLFYLTAGKHTFSLTVTLAEYAEYHKALNKLVADIGEFYLEVVKITGTSPDKNRDYDLFNQINDYEKRLDGFHSDLDELSEQMKMMLGKRGNSFIATVNNMSRVAKYMIDNPYTAQNYLNDFYNQYISLGSWLYEMTSMPLSLDRIVLSAPNDTNSMEKANLFEKLFFGMKRFFFSFTSDYNTLSTKNENGKSLKIWVNWGRDQVMVLNSLIQENFTPKTGISVNLEMTNASLINGMLANIQPDLALQLSRTEPVNLAMRGALYDLSQFDDYEQVLERFGNSASEPYKYKDGVYALPDTQSFYIMFYRKDILGSLGLSIPKTWNEFIETTSVIQRNNLQVYLPYTQITAATTVNTGVGGLNLFASLLQQHGGSFYNSELTKCDLKNATSFKAFTFWTDFYTKYRVPTISSFYNRFRSGTVPLGIEGYTQYTQLMETAPEIKGKWGIALVPGMEKEDGTVDHTVSGSGSGCAIISKSKNKVEAWEFLKWWTSSETQLSYNNNVEAILGSISRTTTATVEAFKKMSWDGDDLEILMEQRSWIKEVPEIPGGYFLSRAIDQAFWEVYNNDENPKDVLTEWTDLTNDEINRKIKEYS